MRSRCELEPDLERPDDVVDFSGDTVLVTAMLGVNPYYLVLNTSGSTALR